jgi:hypothetical protein
MWYREILAYREVTDKEGERTIHQTPAKYERPIFIFDDPSGTVGSAKGIGTETQAFGPGHYTAQSPAVSKGYKDKGFKFRREERLPKGTKILDYFEITPEESQLIINAANKEFGKNIDVNTHAPTLEDIGKLYDDLQLVKIFPLLVKLGYDAVEHAVGSRNMNALEGNIKRLESDPEYRDKEGNLLRGKLKKHLKRSYEKNVIVINRAILTMPDLFQRVRFRPETVSEEEMQRYKDEIQTSEIEYYKHLLDGDAKPEIEPSVAIRLLEAGLDANKISSLIKFQDHKSPENFDRRLENLKIFTKYYDDSIVFKLFTPQEINRNSDKIRNSLHSGQQTQSINRAKEVVLTFEKLEQNLLTSCYTFQNTKCNNYGCGIPLEANATKCNKCGGELIARFYNLKPGLSIQNLMYGAKIINELEKTSTIGIAYVRNEYNRFFLFEQLVDKFIEIFSSINSINSLRDFRLSIVPFLENFTSEQLKKLNEAFLINIEKLQSVPQQTDSQPEQPEQKVSYKIRRTKTAGKVKYYYFNGESKPLKDHLQDIFPGANSVDIYYMADRVRKIALNDDDVSRVLYDAAVGHLFPRYENKR